MEQQIMEVIAGGATIGLMSLMAGNVVISIIAAIAKKEFELRHLGDFATTRVLPLVGYLVVAVLATIADAMKPVVIATYAGLVALYSAGILAALKSLTGLKLPNILTEKK